LHLGTRIGDWSPSGRPGRPSRANSKACRLLLSKIQRPCRPFASRTGRAFLTCSRR